MMKNIQILIIEDSITQAEKLKHILENHSFTVRHELNGVNAFESVRYFTPDIVISDIVMPLMDGYSFCSTLKLDDELKKIPVILLTSLSDPGDVIKGLECGADGFLVKPYSEEFLISRIQYFIQNSELRKNQVDNSLLEVLFAQQKFTINSTPRQILDILLSTYEYSSQKNLELIASNRELKIAQEKLTQLNLNLENEVRIRTSDLEKSNANLLVEIEERKQAKMELLAAMEKAEENNRLKLALLNNMSHEIRTPMNAIMGFSNLLAEAEESEVKMYADIIQKSSNHLLKLLDDVILLSRLQSEKMTIYEYDCIPADIVLFVHQVFQHSDLNNGIDVKVNIPEQHRNFIIRSDEDKVTQVLTNLVSNAVKYTLKGSVEIGFDVCDEHIKFFVKDTGIGIPEKELDKIFETFYRGEQALSSAIRGNGLGLNIAKELVELMGGSIHVNSTHKKGSEFYFRIPINYTGQAESKKVRIESKRVLSSDLNLLIVDDEMLNFQYLEIMLKNKVKKIDHAINGKEALEMASVNSYDMVLMDMKMPVMSGFEATVLLKKKFPGLPIIAQSAYTLPEEKDLAYQAGCDDFISKPIIGDLLFEIIEKNARELEV